MKLISKQDSEKLKRFRSILWNLTMKRFPSPTHEKAWHYFEVGLIYRT